jgi:hypothetical protein
LVLHEPGILVNLQKLYELRLAREEVAPISESAVALTPRRRMRVMQQITGVDGN